MFISILQDRSIAVWDMQSPTEINLRRVLVGHRAAVNVVDFDEKYIVSASGDRTIKVRNLSIITLNVCKRIKSSIMQFDKSFCPYIHCLPTHEVGGI